MEKKIFNSKNKIEKKFYSWIFGLVLIMAVLLIVFAVNKREGEKVGERPAPSPNPSVFSPPCNSPFSMTDCSGEGPFSALNCLCDPFISTFNPTYVKIGGRDLNKLGATVRTETFVECDKFKNLPEGLSKPDFIREIKKMSQIVKITVVNCPGYCIPKKLIQNGICETLESLDISDDDKANVKKFFDDTIPRWGYGWKTQVAFSFLSDYTIMVNMLKWERDRDSDDPNTGKCVPDPEGILSPSKDVWTSLTNYYEAIALKIDPKTGRAPMDDWYDSYKDRANLKGCGLFDVAVICRRTKPPAVAMD